jgi:hypothetical protein
MKKSRAFKERRKGAEKEREREEGWGKCLILRLSI